MGIAQIPRKALSIFYLSVFRTKILLSVYAAPDTALIAGAPALSSFSPRAPLEAAQHKLPLPASVPAVAKASATVDMDGRILEVNKSRNYVKENKRYSSFVRNSAASNNSPSPV